MTTLNFVRLNAHLLLLKLLMLISVTLWYGNLDAVVGLTLQDRCFSIYMYIFKGFMFLSAWYLEQNTFFFPSLFMVVLA